MTTRTTHQIQVRYGAPVADCERRLRVLPRRDERQNVRDEEWNCDPCPAHWRETSDEFGNRVLHLQHNRIERNFRFEVAFHCQTRAEISPAETPQTSPNIGAFLLPSALCDRASAVVALAASDNRSHSDALRAAHLCALSHAALRYDGGAGDIRNTASGVLARERGICGDFAHLLIALCRARGLAARYVAGYRPGEGQMHAWAEIRCDNHWLAFDPTHNRCGDDSYITVARGRDYRDAPPIEGTFRGAGRVRLRTFCHTQILE